MPNHRTVYDAARRARASSPPGADRLELKLQATAPNGDKVVQMLTFHRGSYVIDVAFDITNARQRADHAGGVFPAHARHQARGAAELDGARRRSSARSSTTRPTSSRRSNSATSTSRPPIRRASRRTRRTPTTAGSAWSSTTSSPRGCRRDEPKSARSSTRRKLDGGLYTAGVRRSGAARSRRARTGEVRARALRRPAGPGRARQARQGPRPRRRLRHLHGASRRRCSGCSSGCTACSATGAGRSS